MSTIIREFMALLILLLFVGGFTYSQDMRAEEAARDTPTISTELDSKNYVSIELAYGKYLRIYQELVKKVGPLKSRGEAHITILNPSEFKRLTDQRISKISSEQIKDLFTRYDLAHADFKTVCLGKYAIFKNSKEAATYFLVVESELFLKFRREIAALSGLSKDLFNPELFSPHVTIGFTDRDLHSKGETGKGRSSCQPFLLEG